MNIMGSLGIVGTSILGAIGATLVGGIIAYIKKASGDSKVLIQNITEINDGLKYQNRLNSIQAENISMLVRVDRDHIKASRSQGYAIQELAEGNKKAAIHSAQTSLDHLSDAEDDMERTTNKNQELVLGGGVNVR